MATISVTCPRCFTRYSVDEANLGKRARCNRCENSFVLTRSAQTETKTAGASGILGRRSGRRDADAAVPELWNVGDLILGVYEVKWLNPHDQRKHYAEGGVGLVYRVHHRGWDMDLAVKCPKRDTFRSEQGALDFEGECATWIDLGLHPNIVACYYVRRLGGIPRVFAEFVDGGSLREWVRTKRLYEGGPAESLPRMLDIAIQFAWGLHYAHRQGVVHQDVKPANVMMQNGVPKVTDFGLVRARVAAGEAVPSEPPRDMLVSWAGMTPGYCSPEQARAAVQIEAGVAPTMRTRLTNRTDIWSWGVSVFEMFHGKPPCPHGGHTAAEAFSGYLYDGPAIQGPPPMPPRLAAPRACFEENPDDRPEGMEQIAADLLEIYHDVCGEAYPRQQPVTTELKADALNNRAVSLLDLGKDDEAGRFLEEAWQWHPWQPEVTHNRTVYLWRTGRLTDTDVVTHLEDLCNTRPRDWEPAHSLAQVQLERGEVKAALAALERAAKLGGGSEIEATHARAKSLAQHTASCVRSLRIQPEDLRSVYQSSDDRLALSRLDAERLQVWDVATGHPVLSFAAPVEQPLDTALTADGLFELVAVDERRLELFDVAAGSRAACFHRIVWGPTTLLSGDASWILAAQDDFSIVLRRTDTAEVLRRFVGHAARVNSISLTADECFALTASGDQTIRLWEVASGRCLRTFKGHTNPVQHVFISPDGTWAISASTGTTMRLWNLGVLCDARQHYLTPMLLSRVTSSEEAGQAQAQFADLAVRARAAVRDERPDEALKLAAEARRLPGYEVARESLDLWNFVGRRCRRLALRDAWCARTMAGHASEVTCAAIATDASFALSGDWARTAVLWDLASGRKLRTLEGHSDCIRAAAISPDGRWVATGSWDKSLRLWDTTAGETVRNFAGHTNGVDAAVFSADGRLLLSGSWDKSLRLWQVGSGRCLQVLKGHSHYVDSVALSADGRLAISGGEDSTVRTWNTADGRGLAVFTGHTGWVTAVAMTPDGRWALSAGKDGTLRLWDLARGCAARTIEAVASPLHAVGLSADGRWGVSGGKDGAVRLWSLDSGACVHVLEGHTDAVNAVALSTDCRWVLSASKDATVRLWELDWEYDFPGWSEPDEVVAGHLTTFLTMQCVLAKDGMHRAGKPTWNNADLHFCLETLSQYGYGWISADGIRRELKAMTAAWKGPPALPGEK